MKKLTIDFPIIGWASVSVEVDDHVKPDDLLDQILNDEFEVEWDGRTYEQLIPVMDIEQAVRELYNTEIPAQVQVLD